MLNASLNFVGQGLTFRADGPGMSIDPATGQVTISSDVLLSGIEVTVTDGGSTVSRFRVTVATQEDAVVKPAPLMAPTLSGTGVIGASVAVDPGQWSGQPEPTLALQWRAGEVAIPGATAADFVPTPAEDGADLDCLVTATNAGGSEALAAGPLRVTQAPPVALGAIADLVLTQGAAAGRVEAAGHFSGADLSFSVDGAGAEVDASGVISVPTGALLAEEVVVTVRNSGGSAEIRFHVTVAAQEVPVVKPAPLVAPTLSGTGVVGTRVEVDPGQWSGQPEPTLALQWRADEVAIPGATAADFVPTPAEDGADLDCLVTATNAGGSEALAAGPLRVTQAPPVALGAIADLVLTQGDAPGRVEAAGHFSGAGLSFSVEGAGAEVDASGVISVPTGGLLAEEVVVTASNSGGSAEIRFHVTVAKQEDPVVQPPVALGAIADLVLTQGGAPGRVEAAEHFSGTGLSFSVDGAGAEVDASGVIVLPTGDLLAEEPVTITASNAGGAATALFRMSVIPAKIDPALIQIDEITSTSDPDKGNGGRRRLILGDIVIPAGYELRWTSPDVDGGIPPGTIVTPNATSVRNNSLAVGVSNYNVLYWYRLKDQICFNALPASGATANGKTLTPTPQNAADGQIVIRIAGLGGDTTPAAWPALGTTAINNAVSYPMAEFTNKGGAGSNITQSRNAYVAAAYGSFCGTTSTDPFVLGQLDRLLDGRYMPAGMSGPAAVREASAITFFQLIKLTPRLYDTLSATKKSQMEWIVKGLLLVNAWMGSDTAPGGHAGGDAYLTGFDDGVGVKSVGPNIAFGIPANIVNAACYLGASAASTFLQTITMATIRSQIAGLFGTSSLLYKTLNWRKEGVSASGATSYYRADASSLAPSDATVESALRNFRYYGAALPDLQAILLPNSTRGLNRCLPPANWTDKGSNPYIGIALHSCLNNTGLKIGSTVYGACLNNQTGMPHLGDVGCMIYELNGIDGGGLRSSMGYAAWTKAAVDCVVLSLAVTEALDLTSPQMSDFLIRWKKASDIVNYFDENDYRSCAHNTTDSSGKVTATKPGGPSTTHLWSADRDKFAIPAHRALWDALRVRLKIPAA